MARQLVWSIEQMYSLIQSCTLTIVAGTGQTKPTRVIRLLTEGTIEKALLAYQRSKVGSANQQADQLQEQELLAGNTLADLLEAHP